MCCHDRWLSATKRITKKTPATFKELGKKRIKRAQREKRRTGKTNLDMTQKRVKNGRSNIT